MTETTTDRLERISILIDNYMDVEMQGLRDAGGNGEHLALMSRAWNHPSYRQLDILLGLMRDQQRGLYWHLAQSYFYAPTRRVLACAKPHCEATWPTWVTLSFHQHGRQHVPLVPRAIRQVNPVVDRVQVQDAFAWLEDRWLGEVYLPDELAHLAA